MIDNLAARSEPSLWSMLLQINGERKSISPTELSHQPRSHCSKNDGGACLVLIFDENISQQNLDSRTLKPLIKGDDCNHSSAHERWLLENLHWSSTSHSPSLGSIFRCKTIQIVRLTDHSQAKPWLKHTLWQSETATDAEEHCQDR